MKYYRDLINSLDTAWEEGKLEGKIEGIEEGKLEVAKNGFKEGLPIELIQKLTGIIY